MERRMMRDGGRLAFADFLAAGTSPVGLEQLRLDRLFELRAMIDSLRSERERGPWPAPLAERGSG